MGKELSRIHRWWIKISHWEFWPFSVLYFPVFFYYFWLSLKRGSLFFFTSSNPTIEFGGMLGEKKSAIYQLIPSKYLPSTQLFDPGEVKKVKSFANQLGYPVIVKPNIGERGTLVEKIDSVQELENYVSKCKVPFLVQELVDYPVELGVFYIRKPSDKYGYVTSIVQKQFLQVTGNGKSTVDELLRQIPRANLQVDFSHPRIKNKLDQVPKKGDPLQIEPIGNHCRGTMFLNRNDQIDEPLHLAFNKIAREIDGFYFGRFDLRCQSFDDLRALKNFKLLELNGAGAEPGHIYQPGYPLFKAYQDILWHLNTLSDISFQNKKKGHAYWTFSRGIRQIREVSKYNRMLDRK